jgi:hypothetical protein
MNALMRLTIKNTGTAPVYKGVAILRNETGRQIFLRKGRIEFPEEPKDENVTIDFKRTEEIDFSPVNDGSVLIGETSESNGKIGPGSVEPLPGLQPGEVAEVEFSFQVRDGQRVDFYDFELAMVDSYSSVNLVRSLSIPCRDKEDTKPFPNGVEFAPPRITLSAIDPGTGEPTVVTSGERIQLNASIETPSGQPFKAWIFKSRTGYRELPDKIYFADSRGDSKLDITKEVDLEEGSQSFTVVVSDRQELEARQTVFVRRE